jgi:hypothetical protein
MSSWSGSRSGLSSRNTKQLYGFKPTTGGICSNLNQLLFSYIYCQRIRQPLYVLDHPNCISDTFPIFKSLFQPIQGLLFVNSFPANTLILQHKHIVTTLSNITPDDFKMAALKLLAFLPEAQERIVNEIPESFTQFDLGIHIRSGDKITQGEMQTIPISVYKNAIDQVLQTKSSLNIFVMTDNTEALLKLKEISPPTWTFQSLDTDSTGHIQSVFNEKSPSEKESEFYRFMAELSIMQTIPTLLVTYSSNVGRYLYLTSPSTTRIKSLDLPHWTF